MNIFLIDFENVNSSGLNGINRLDSSDQVIIFYSENADSMTFDLHEQINSSKAYIFFQKVDVGLKNALDFQLATYLGYLICENEKEHKDAYYYLVTKDRGYASLVTYWAKRGIDIMLVGSLASGKIVPDGGTGGTESPKKQEAGPAEAVQEPAEKKKGKGKSRSKSGDQKKSKGDKEQAKADEVQSPDKEGEGKKSHSGKKSRKKKDESPEQKQLRIQVEQAVPDKSVTDLVVSYIQKYKTKLGINNALAKEFKDSKKASEIYKSIKPLIADKKGQ